VTFNNLDQPSVVTISLIQTLSWKERKARMITCAEDGVLEQVLLRIIPLIGADKVIE
jgi:mRNA interferase MazF